jgi:thiamine biosynthesis protein ThiS
MSRIQKLYNAVVLSDSVSPVTEGITVTINGEPREVASNLSVAGLLTSLDLPSDRVAVELNRTLIRKRDWAQTQVLPASHIEIVEFVGGG